MTDSIDAEERRTEIALFRYTLILPLLRSNHEPGGKSRLCEQIASGSYDIPHSTRRSVSAPTLRRWERRYNQQGFDGLKPKPRSDRGQPRTISPETLDRAEALKRQQPYRSSRSIVRALSLDSTQPIPEETIAPRTLRRQLALRDATTSQLPPKALTTCG
jgi:putative transposase